MRRREFIKASLVTVLGVIAARFIPRKADAPPLTRDQRNAMLFSMLDGDDAAFVESARESFVNIGFSQDKSLEMALGQFELSNALADG